MRIFLDSFDRKFEALHLRGLQLLEMTPEGSLYRRPRELPQTFAIFTVGEYLLRSAASVEQTFGGITTRLWDDPFEWTLPEKLNSKDLVTSYLSEADIARRRGMAFLESDEALGKMTPAPSEIRSIFEILTDTLVRAEHFQGRAAGVLQYFIDQKLPRV